MVKQRFDEENFLLRKVCFKPLSFLYFLAATSFPDQLLAMNHTHPSNDTDMHLKRVTFCLLPFLLDMEGFYVLKGYHNQ